MMNETKQHSHDANVDVRAAKTWRNLFNVVQRLGYPVLLLRLNTDMRPEGPGFLAETDQQYRQIIQSWLDQHKNLHIRIVPGQIAKAQA